MGINYSFVLLCERSRIDAVLTALAEHLAPGDAARVRGALPWRPASEGERVTQAGESAVDARGMRGMDRSSVERTGDAHCFSLALQVEEAEHAEWPQKLADGRTAVGCLWTTVRAGRQFAAIELSAASSSMSRLLDLGSDARAVFVEIARKGGARALLFDRENVLLEQLHPKARSVERPDEERHWFADDYEMDVDGCYQEILLAASDVPS